MIHSATWIAVAVFAAFVAVTLGISSYFARRTRSAQGYFAAHGEIHWFVNGIAFAGDYLSAASFLGICGMIAFFGYDGFLYSIGYLAGWIVALFVIAEPLRALGKYTFADALDNRFGSRGIKLAAAISTLAVSIFYLIPQMVGAGVLIRPLLGLEHWHGVVMVGAVVIFIVTTAGMVSTTYVQFLKGSLLVVFSVILTGLILSRGLTARDDQPASLANDTAAGKLEGFTEIPLEGDWKDKPYKRFVRPISRSSPFAPTLTYREVLVDRELGVKEWLRCETIGAKDGASGTLVNGAPQVAHGEPNANDLNFVGTVRRIPDDLTLPEDPARTGSMGPIAYLSAIQRSEIVLWDKEKLKDADGSLTVYFPRIAGGNEVLRPGNLPAFKGIRSEKFSDKLNFLSLMLALFCGTASLPHILIRYYTVKDRAAARASTVVGIGSIGFFYILTLFMGLGAMTSGQLDVTDSNMAAPLLARGFGELMFASISAIAFTTVLGTVSGLIVAASGAVAHDLLSGFLRLEMNDHSKVRAGKITAVVVGVIAIALGILFQRMNVTYLVGWAFSVAASANLPALVMLLFWRRTTREGVIAAIVVGMVASLAWILLSGDTFRDVYGISPDQSPVPFSQPGIVTIPLGFLTLIVVSLFTGRKTEPGR